MKLQFDAKGFMAEKIVFKAIRKALNVNETIYSLIGMGIGTILGGAIGLINTYLTNTGNVPLEKLKMHEGGRIEAYKNLLHFSESIFGDPTDDMSRGFLLSRNAK